MKTRLEHFLDPGQVSNVRYDRLNDVVKIKELLPELNSLTNIQVSDLYHTYCEYDYYCSWIEFTEFYVSSFRRWLNERLPRATFERY